MKTDERNVKEQLLKMTTVNEELKNGIVAKVDVKKEFKNNSSFIRKEENYINRMAPSELHAEISSRIEDEESFKLRNFWGTLYRYGLEISSEAGTRIRCLIIGLVCGTLSMEEFASALETTTKFTLKPVILNFLCSRVPYMTEELLTKAKQTDQSPQQYLRNHEDFLFDSATVTAVHGSFTENGKRKFPDSYFPYEYSPALKRPFPISMLGSWMYYGSSLRKEMEEEWKNIHVMLSCILNMVEKTQKALGILQERCLFSYDFELTSLLSSPSMMNANQMKQKSEKFAEDVLKAIDVAEEEEYKIEENIKDMKKQSMLSFQKSEIKIKDKLETESIRMERLNDVKRMKISSYDDDQCDNIENCWNCGRKATETCSGCSVARYCGSFCQHKDWYTHHKICGSCFTSNNSSPEKDLK